MSETLQEHGGKRKLTPIGLAKSRVKLNLLNCKKIHKMNAIIKIKIKYIGKNILLLYGIVNINLIDMSYLHVIMFISK